MASSHPRVQPAAGFHRHSSFVLHTNRRVISGMLCTGGYLHFARALVLSQFSNLQTSWQCYALIKLLLNGAKVQYLCSLTCSIINECLPDRISFSIHSLVIGIRRVMPPQDIFGSQLIL